MWNRIVPEASDLCGWINYDNVDQKWAVTSAKFEVTTGRPGGDIQESVRKGSELDRSGLVKGQWIEVFGRKQRIAC